MTPDAVIAELRGRGIDDERISRHLRLLLPPPAEMVAVLRRQCYSPIPATRADAIVDLTEALARANAQEPHTYGKWADDVEETIAECSSALAELYRLDRDGM